jgi:hypothetical protein
METDNIQDIIKARYRELPPEVQKAITASDLPQKFETLSKKYALRIDQSDVLQTEILLVMLGLRDSDHFTENLVKNAEMKRETAQLISADVNTNIIGTVKSILRDITSAEDTGDEETGFAETKPAAITTFTAPTIPMNREDLLKDLENPPAFIDHLLTGTSTSVNETVEKQAPIPANVLATAQSATQPAAQAQSKPQPEVTVPTKPRIDPYREPIE